MEKQHFRQLPGQALGVAKWLLRALVSPTTLVSLVAVALSATIFTVAYLSNVVYIIDGDSATVTVTAEKDFMKILANEEIAVGLLDQVEVTPADGGSFSQLNILRPFSVSITVDGETKSYDCMEGTTVGQLLVGHGIELRDADKITHTRDVQVMPGDQVVITRVDARRVEEQVVVPFETEKRGTSVLAMGRTKTLQSGSNGSLKRVWEEILEDGQVVDRYVVQEVVLKNPVTAKILVGDGSPVSSFDFSAKHPLDANGNPTNYIDVLTGQKATGYWRAGKAWGSGYWTTQGKYGHTYCQAGTVAVVRLDQMPYGTKLYIKTPDGKFIYGYSVVNDTGEFASNGVTVDLFYDTYEESVLNSVRWVDIYILEYAG